MVYVSDQYRLAFFAAPATGSTAVINTLQNAGIGRFLPETNLVRDGKRIAPRKHTTIEQMRDAGLYSEIEDHMHVVGLRNPFSWFVAKHLRNRTKRMRNVENRNSWIHDLPKKERESYIANIRRQAEMPFDKFLKSTLGRRQPHDPQVHFHQGMHFYLHQEALAEDFSELVRRLGLPEGLALETHNVTGAMKKGETYHDFYDDDLVRLVYEKNAPFFDQFPEYSFKGYDASRVREQEAQLGRY